jgi:hypothetical protein
MSASPLKADISGNRFVDANAISLQAVKNLRKRTWRSPRDRLLWATCGASLFNHLVGASKQ